MSQLIQKMQARARAALGPLRKSAQTQHEILRACRAWLRDEDMRMRFLHRAGEIGGVEFAGFRARVIDTYLGYLFEAQLVAAGLKRTDHPVTLVADGGYGRRTLNPCSDVDLLFLLPGKSSRNLDDKTKEVVGRIYLTVNDCRLKVGHAVRTVAECCDQACNDHETKTALLDARFLVGDHELFDSFQAEFQKRCLKGQEEAYLEDRRRDVKSRQAKQSGTVYLQEPHVKNGCGGLRDYQNILWVARVKTGARSLSELVKKKLLSAVACKEMEKAHDFLHRVRNELHYLERRAQDQLTLRLQGRVATNLKYPQRKLLERIEVFMRDYYHHTRNIWQHASSLMERFELAGDGETSGPRSFLARIQRKTEHFDGFVSRKDSRSKRSFIYPLNDRVFKEDPDRAMRLFQHTQVRHLELSPEMRVVFRTVHPLINTAFRYRKTNRETFEAILSRKGDVARVLRQMHRVGFLGRYLPEFGALTDLVQHEFFHRYSADEHTLRVVEQIDALMDLKEPTPVQKTLQDILQDLEDPFVIYLAILLHDSGRATEAEHHEYASAMLADKVCRRLSIAIDRRRQLLFLVDHHLTLWRTATTRNIEDPNVIAEFAGVVRHKRWLDALFLMTYADSRGTNEQAWSGFKESLLTQLYRMTVSYFNDQQAFFAQFRQAENAEFRAEVAQKLGDGWEDEIAAHFSGMPDRYFVYRSTHRVARHLQLVRQFLAREIKGDDTQVPTIRWRTIPEQACSELTLVSRDRHMLLARVAGCLSACRLNILSADFFLRKDGLVFDVFRVCTTNLEPVDDDRTLAKFNRYLAETFQTEDPDFDALVPGLERPEDPEQVQMRAEFPTRVFISNDVSPHHTVVEIDAVDRLGLLCDFFRTIGALGLEIAHARINTEKGAAMDTLYLTDADGRKIEDRETLGRLRHGLERIALHGPARAA